MKTNNNFEFERVEEINEKINQVGDLQQQIKEPQRLIKVYKSDIKAFQISRELDSIKTSNGFVSNIIHTMTTKAGMMDRAREVLTDEQFDYVFQKDVNWKLSIK